MESSFNRVSSERNDKSVFSVSVMFDVTDTNSQEASETQSEEIAERTGIVFDNYTKEIIEYEKNWVRLVLPDNDVNIDELKDCLMSISTHSSTETVSSG